MIASTPKRQQLGLSHRRYSVLTNDEISELCVQAQAGCIKSRNLVVNANLRLVVKIANKFYLSGVPVGDLINEGFLGLNEAVERFDVNRKASFSSFAVWWIRQRICLAIHEQNVGIKAPSASSLKRELKAAEERNLPHLIESAKNRIEAFHKIRYPISLDELAVEGFDPVGNLECSDEKLNDSEVKNIISHLLQSLNAREQKIIKLFFGFNGSKETNQEISDKLSISKQRVHEIKKRTIKILRKRITIKRGDI